MMILDPSIHIAVILIIVAAVMIAFAMERYPLEVVALSCLSFLLLFYQAFPVLDETGLNMLNPMQLLAGFANPSLAAVIALLVMGQGLVQANALAPLIRVLSSISKDNIDLGVFVGLIGVLVISGMLNNTPLVVMFSPILQSLASQARRPLGRIMMPLSYAAILGGMTTVVGSSTNLLVSSALTDLGLPALSFFAFIVPGSVLALTGFAYVMFILPRLLPDRETLTRQFAGGGKQFIAELTIPDDSALIGETAKGNRLEKLPDVMLRLVHRQNTDIMPPFDSYTVAAGDVLIIAAGRDALMDLLASTAGDMLVPNATASLSQDEQPAEPSLATDSVTSPAVEDHGDDAEAGQDKTEQFRQLRHGRVIAEVMVAPASRLTDRTLDQSGWDRRFSSMVLGIQRRARMVRGRLNNIRLLPGDVLLVMGTREMLEELRGDSDLLILAQGVRDLPTPGRAPHAVSIFAATVGLAAFGLLPIDVAAIAGATVMILLGCLNMRQAIRAIDRNIVFLVAASLALGSALSATGAADAVAQSFLLAVEMAFADPPAYVVASLLFLMVAIATNLISNNACAVLFTPIAVNMADTLGIDPLSLAITVVLAANCSFASPIGYQTNLLVMGPGNYRFRDFIRGGAPLVLLLWLAYTIMAPFLFNPA